MITVQQIVFTEQTERWHALAAAIGFVPPYPPSPEWAEFDGGGVLAVHRAGPEHPAGRVDLNLLVDDLDAAQAALNQYATTRSEMEGVGEMLTVRAASGLEIAVFEGARAAIGEVSVQPIWFQDDIPEARGILEALGMRATIAADSDGWLEMHADGGGSVGLHSVSGRAEGAGSSFGLSFLARGDLDALCARVNDAGFSASVVDEAWTRTIRVEDPDGGLEIWISAVQDDLYGYRRVD